MTKVAKAATIEAQAAVEIGSCRVVKGVPTPGVGKRSVTKVDLARMSLPATPGECCCCCCCSSAVWVALNAPLAIVCQGASSTHVLTRTTNLPNTNYVVELLSPGLQCSASVCSQCDVTMPAWRSSHLASSIIHKLQRVAVCHAASFCRHGLRH
jgi:hypothetical protein